MDSLDIMDIYFSFVGMNFELPGFSFDGDEFGCIVDGWIDARDIDGLEAEFGSFEGEFDLFADEQGFEAFIEDAGIMHKDFGVFIAADEAVAFAF